jgi:hypothetical protein
MPRPRLGPDPSGRSAASVGAPPRVGDSVSVEQPQKRGDEEQNRLIDGSRKGQEADYCQPAQRARDLTVAGQKPDSPDYTSRAVQEGRLRTDPPKGVAA